MITYILQSSKAGHAQPIGSTSPIWNHSILQSSKARRPAQPIGPQHPPVLQSKTRSAHWVNIPHTKPQHPPVLQSKTRSAHWVNIPHMKPQHPPVLQSKTRSAHWVNIPHMKPQHPPVLQSKTRSAHWVKIPHMKPQHICTYPFMKQVRTDNDDSLPAKSFVLWYIHTACIGGHLHRVHITSVHAGRLICILEFKAQ